MFEAVKALDTNNFGHLSQNFFLLMGIQVMIESYKPQKIALLAKAANLSNAGRGRQGFLAKVLSFVNIG